jgi:hypothetical protein
MGRRLKALIGRGSGICAMIRFTESLSRPNARFGFRSD